VAQLQGVPIPASDLETRVLPARIEGYRPGDIDALIAAGEVTWIGRGALGPRNGRIALYLTEDLPLFVEPGPPVDDARCSPIREVLAAHGAVFFPDIVDAIGGGFEPEKLELLWDLVWAGEVTNDTLAPVRALVGSSDRPRRRERVFGRPLPRRRLPRGSEGRWSLVAPALASPTPTERAAALAAQLLDRYGVLTREAVGAEGARGGFSSVYPVLNAMESAAKVQRGYFVEGLGAAQFATAGAAAHLRKERPESRAGELLVLAATDPANAFGAALPWPATREGNPRREAGARVVIWRGHLLGWLSPSSQSLIGFALEDEVEDDAAAALADALVTLAGGRAGLLLATIDGEDARRAPLAALLTARGFTPGARGLVGRLLGPAGIGDVAEGT
jgi:ATP-dependent Lhr-like helicase